MARRSALATAFCVLALGFGQATTSAPPPAPALPYDPPPISESGRPTAQFQLDSVVRQIPGGKVYYDSEYTSTRLDGPGPPWLGGFHTIWPESQTGGGVRLLAERGFKPVRSQPLASCNQGDQMLFKAMNTPATLEPGERAFYKTWELRQGPRGLVIDRDIIGSPVASYGFYLPVERRGDQLVLLEDSDDPWTVEPMDPNRSEADYLELSPVSASADVTSARDYKRPPTTGTISSLKANQVGIVNSYQVWFSPDGKCFIDEDAVTYPEPLYERFFYAQVAVRRTPAGLIAQLGEDPWNLQPASGGIGVGGPKR